MFVLVPVLTVRVEVPDPPEEILTVVGLKDAVGGLETKQGSTGGVQSAGEAYTATERLAEPEYPFKLAIVIVDVPEFRLAIVRLFGLAETLKSLTVAVTVALCDRPPLVDVIVTM